MAESSVLVSALFQAILEKTTSLLLNEFRGLVGVRKKLWKLEKSLRGAQSLIEEAEEKQLEDRSIRIWLSELKDVAYEAEDIVDELRLEFLWRKQPKVLVKLEMGLRAGQSMIKEAEEELLPGRSIVLWRWLLQLKDAAYKAEDKADEFLRRKAYIQDPLRFRVRMGRRLNEAVERLNAIAAQRRNYAVPESTTSFSLDEELTSSFWSSKLEEMLRAIQSKIEEAEEKRRGSIKFWLSELKGVACGAEDMVDELCHFSSSQDPLRFRVIMGRRLNEVVERFDAIAAQRMNYDVPESTTSVVGRIEDPKNIVEMLLSQGENNESITVLPIEIGVRLSEPLAEIILESVSGNRFDAVGPSMESLRHSLSQMLRSKRCILVSDEDVTMWEQLKLMSSFGPRGRALIANNSSSDEQDKYNIETLRFLVYSFAEIVVATNGFSQSTKIGKGGYGSVYKGKLRGTNVAIKMLDSHSNQSKQEFFHELDVLCQMRHQNLVNLIGACFECYALVYEFLPNGSLEDCLRNCSSLLTWKIRTRIIFDICSSLKFLHSRSVVHGDIKPHNILLDASFNGKLADFGFCRFLPKGTTSVAFLETGPRGTFEYIEFNFLETGILRPCSDLYSFGVTILKLVTGQQPLGLSRRVSAAHKNTFEFGKMIDATAGSWPFELAHELAYWGLECCYNNEKSSQLMDDMWICLEEMLAEITGLQ